MSVVVPGPANIGLFLSAALLVLLTPGPAVLLIVARTIEQGRLAGLVSVAGIHAATLVHVLAAAVGVSAVLASSVLAFSIVKYAGAAYLIWLGVRKLLGPTVSASDVELLRHSHARLLRDGFFVNLLNPKTALFFLAFLPQFVEVDRGHVSMQVAFLGLVFIALGTATDASYALAAGTARAWLKRGRFFLRFERYVSGTLYIALGATAAFAGNGRK